MKDGREAGKNDNRPAYKFKVGFLSDEEQFEETTRAPEKRQKLFHDLGEEWGYLPAINYTDAPPMEGYGISQPPWRPIPPADWAVNGSLSDYFCREHVHNDEPYEVDMWYWLPNSDGFLEQDNHETLDPGQNSTDLDIQMDLQHKICISENGHLSCKTVWSAKESWDEKVFEVSEIIGCKDFDLPRGAELFQGEAEAMEAAAERAARNETRPVYPDFEPNLVDMMGAVIRRNMLQGPSWAALYDDHMDYCAPGMLACASVFFALAALRRGRRYFRRTLLISKLQEPLAFT